MDTLAPISPSFAVSCALSVLLALNSFPATAQNAMVFSEEGDYLDIAHDTSLSTPEFTHEFWLEVRKLGDPEKAGGEQTIMDKRGADAGYNVRLAGTEWPISLFSFHGPDDNWVAGLGEFYPNVWIHLAITQSADSAKLYLNGEFVDGRESTYDHRSQSQLRIGELLAYPGYSLPLRGALDEFRIWDHERPADSIRAHVHAPVSTLVPGLQLYYDFEDVDGDTLRDLSPLGNDAAVFGSAYLAESTAPVDYVPPPVPYGLRAYGGEGQIELIWKSYGLPVDRYQIHRGDSANFVPDAGTAIAAVRAPDTTYIDNDVVDGRSYYYRLRARDAADHVSLPGHVAASRTTVLQDTYLAGIYYDAVYGPGDGGKEWTDGYMRQYLVPPQPPILGEYNNRDPEVIRQHLAWMEEYGIDFIMANWWTRWSRTGLTVRDYLLPELANSSVKFAIMLRCARLGGPIDEADRDTLLTEFTYLANGFFNHPSYLMIDGRPVVFLNAMANMEGEFEEAFAAVRDSMSTLGYDVYLIGDDVRFDPINDNHLGFLDAAYYYEPFVTNQHYGYVVENDYLADISTLASRWDELTSQNDVAYVPTVFRGYNNRTGGGGNMAIPPQVQPGAKCTSLLDNMIREMRPFVDPQLRMILIDSWNRWQWDTQIEPTVITEPTHMDTSPEGNFYTQGYTYEGYGMQPLVVVRSLLAAELTVGTEPKDLPTKAPVTMAGYPNPFQDRARITIDVSDRTAVTVEIYDVLGRRISILKDGLSGPGIEHFDWDGSDVTAGLYFIRARVGDGVKTIPIVKVASRP